MLPLPEFTICSSRYSSSLSPQHVFSDSAEDGTETDELRRFMKSLQSGSPSKLNISCSIGFFTCSSTVLKSSHPSPGFVLTLRVTKEIVGIELSCRKHSSLLSPQRKDNILSYRKFYAGSYSYKVPGRSNKEISQIDLYKLY